MPKNLIIRGQRIIAMDVAQHKIRFRDSLQYISASPLSSFPTMFDLDSGPKGCFPLALNCPKWIRWDRRKQLVYSERDGKGGWHRFPPLKYFLLENLSAKKKTALEAWHGKQVDRFAKNPRLRYWPRAELLRYCRTDVVILQKGFLKFRAEWLRQYPDLELLSSVTFPSFNNALYR